MSNVTIRDLAQRLGVSIATVSMALNNRPGISEETRQRVLLEVQKSGYDMDRLNTPPSKKRSTIDFVIYKKHGRVVDDTPFFSALIQSIEQEAANAGHNLGIRYVTDGSPVTANGDRMILLGTEMSDSDIEPYLSLDCPLVVLDNRLPDLPVNTVSIDNHGGVVSAVKHLIECGHKQIGYFASSDSIRNFDERFESFCSALAAYGLKPVEVISLPANMEGARQEMERHLAASDLKGTAYLAGNDFIALGAQMSIRERYEIGKEISIIGFDDLPLARVFTPQLTTIRVFHDMLGRIAVRRVLELQKETRQHYMHTVVGGELRIRDSVAIL